MKRGFWRIFCIAAAVMAALCAVFPEYRRLSDRRGRVTVTIAVAEDPLVENFNTNYYTSWLEDETGYDIEFVYFSEGYEKEYLRALLFDGAGGIDAVFLPKETEILSVREFSEYVQGGYICELNLFARPSSNITLLREKNRRNGDSFYYMPRMLNSKKDMNTGVLWINTHWLSKLSLRIPETYAELEFVLQSFLEGDPNGNGESDEIPIISGDGGGGLSFDDFVRFEMGSPVRSVEYCVRLREIGVLSDECVTFSNRQVRELINSPDDCVGAFVAKSVSDYIYPNGSDVIARYTAVPPLASPSGNEGGSTDVSNEQIGGFIPENAVHKQEAFEIMDLMLSEEASVIATYGEKGVDYRDAAEGEISAYGNKAELATINYLGYSMQNKNFRGAGPMNLSQAKSDEVKWGGEGSYVEYMDARAVRLYEKQHDE